MPTEAGRYALSVILDSNSMSGWGNGTIEYMAALDAIEVVTSHLHAVKSLHRQKGDWLLGFITYDYKNQIEKLTSRNISSMSLPDLCFFRPRYLFIKDKDNFRLEYTSDTAQMEQSQLLERLQNHVEGKTEIPSLGFRSKVESAKHKHQIQQIQQHIRRGDIYELNYCTEHYACPATIDPASVWMNLIEESPTPFSAYVKYHEQYTLTASPERYLFHCGGFVMSQPIKGTAARSAIEQEDEASKFALATSEKERAENIMITDLVRNDLSRIAEKGTVNVDELCKIYGFRQVWQMITTISATLNKNHHWSDALHATFPMGSMTGAPKIKAMQLIDEFEDSKRGMYSGTVGYITPAGDFDFNVVIRSLFYNEKERYLSFMTGSAITIGSIPEDEYKECGLKAAAILKIFNQ